jgi:GNAT superfamily N-acetyltransferase
MKKATIKDKSLVVNILLESFKNDPYMHWITNISNNPNKLKYVIEYAVDDTFENGSVYLSDNNLATALWNTQKHWKFSPRFIWRNIVIFFRLGGRSVQSLLKKDFATHKHYPAVDKYWHLYFIGVLPKGQGKGLSSELLNPILDKCNQESIPVILETASLVNVEIYKKKGFSMCYTSNSDDISIYFMIKPPELVPIIIENAN